MAVLTLVGALASGSVTHAAFWNSGSYEECMVAEMKGQADLMYQMVHKVCAKRYDREEMFFTGDSIKIEWSYDVAAHLSVKKNESEYNVSRVRFKFSDKACESSKPEDFTFEKEATFVRDQATVQVPLNKTPGASACMRTEALWGKYK
jgi:hypothetical protein